MTFVPLIIAWLLIGFAQNVMMLYAAGLIQGIHAGNKPTSLSVIEQ